MATKTAPRHPGTRPRRAAAATRADARANVRAATARRQRRRGYLLGGLALVVVVTIIGAMMYTARTTSSTATRTAPDFTLTDTGGRAVHLADYRGRNVVLYFSEGHRLPVLPLSDRRHRKARRRLHRGQRDHPAHRDEHRRRHPSGHGR